jgi:hypothetical protein
MIYGAIVARVPTHEPVTEIAYLSIFEKPKSAIFNTPL